MGTATFGAAGNGRPGLATFGVSYLQLWPRYEDLEIDDQSIADAASVLLGRTELQELTGQGFPTQAANQVGAALHGVQCPRPMLPQCHHVFNCLGMALANFHQVV